MRDIISIAVECQDESDDPVLVKQKFCDKLLDEFSKMKGEDLLPHLEKTFIDVSKNKTKIVLSF